MKGLFKIMATILLLSVFLFVAISCSNDTKDIEEGVSASGGISINNKQVEGIKDYYFYDGYAVIPVWKVLHSIGAEISHDSQYNDYDYHAIEFELNGTRFVLSYSKKVFMLAEDFSSEIPSGTLKNKCLFYSAMNIDSTQNIHHYIDWREGEVYVDTDLFCKALTIQGFDIAIDIDVQERTVSILF